MKNSRSSGQRQARRRDHLNLDVAEITRSTANAKRRGVASSQGRVGTRQIHFDDQAFGVYYEPSALDRRTTIALPESDDCSVEEEWRDKSIHTLFFKYLIIPIAVISMAWLFRTELLNQVRIVGHSVAWAVIGTVPVILAWVIGQIVRLLWRRGYKRTASLSGTVGFLMIGYLALNVVSPLVCDDAIDSALKRMPHPGAQVVYARRAASYERVVLPLDRRIIAGEIGQSAIRLAVTAIEDERFFNRWTGPIDAEALLRAMVQTFVWKQQQGGSTILVQAAKLAQGKLRSSLGDKPYQFLLALRLNQRFPSDEEQLAFYLNLVQLDGLHGMAYTASSFYGVANLSELKTTEPRGIAESAMLAGMLKSPTKYHPRHHPILALERRNLVLRKMHKAGAFGDLAAMEALPLDVCESPRVTEFDFFARVLRRNNG